MLELLNKLIEHAKKFTKTTLCVWLVSTLSKNSLIKDVKNVRKKLDKMDVINAELILKLLLINI